jgi:L-amino acid N-acyltransferase YncA
MAFTIRDVQSPEDIAAMCAIYAPYVEASTCTWAIRSPLSAS